MDSTERDDPDVFSFEFSAIIRPIFRKIVGANIAGEIWAR